MELNERNYLSDLVKQEAPNRFSREEVTVLAGDGARRELALGAVIGRQVVADAVSVTAGAGNTGDGAVGAVTLGKAAVPGTYRLACVKAVADGGVFEVVTPDGNRLKDLKVGVAYVSDHLNLTLSDGGTDFALDDYFNVVVSPGDGKVTAIDFAADDGRQEAHGVMIGEVAAPDGVDAVGVALVRDAVLSPSFLVWPAGATAPQKAAALAELAAKGIITREEA